MSYRLDTSLMNVTSLNLYPYTMNPYDDSRVSQVTIPAISNGAGGTAVTRRCGLCELIMVSEWKQVNRKIIEECKQIIKREHPKKSWQQWDCDGST